MRQTKKSKASHKQRDVEPRPADSGPADDQDQPQMDVTESTDSEAHPGDESASATTDATATQEDQLTRLRRELSELREKNLRLHAEAENVAKRAQREKQQALRFAEAEFARELLVVLDDLERTQQSAKTARDVQAVADGVRIVYDHFLKVLGQCNIAPIEAVGRTFDPAFHEAMMQQPSDQYPAGTVMQELARGYTMHERVLRPSRVIVSGGPPEKTAGKEPKPAQEKEE